MNNNVFVNINQISDLQKTIENKGIEMINLLTKIIKENNKMKEIYDSPTATIYQQNMGNYLENRINYIKDNYLSLLKILEYIKNTYIDENEKIKKMVGE